MVGPNYIKRINQARILNLLRVQGKMSRAEIARQLTLTRSTVSLLTADLMKSGVIIDCKHFSSVQTTGRPSVGMQLNPKGGYFIGVEIGVERIRVIALNLMVEILSKISTPLKTKDPAAVEDQVVALIRKVQGNTLRGHPRLLGVGITVPGMLNRRNIVEYASMLGWRNVDLRPNIEEKLGIPVCIENDANAAALAEFYFGGTNVDENLFYLLLDVGVGGGMIIDGKIYTGSFGTAGEIGHLRLPLSLDFDGEFQTKSFEDCVGKGALLKLYKQSGGHREDFFELYKQLEMGDAAALRAVSQWGKMLSMGILTIIDIVNPSHIVLGGPLAKLFPFAQKSFSLLLPMDPFPGARSVQFIQSRFNEDACVMGAAAIVYESLFRVDQPN
jgi:predicted NBD/HSP70 family sugar kinase